MSLYQAYVKPDKIISVKPDKKQALRATEQIIDTMEPIDWKTVVEGLMESGISMGKIALTLGCSKPTVKGWTTGSIPNYESGRKLLAMSATVRNACRKTSEEGV